MDNLSYNLEKIYSRHFMATAKLVGFDASLMSEILNDIRNTTSSVIPQCQNSCNDDFNEFS